MKREILNINEIVLLVDTFYQKVQKDDILSEIFDQKLHDCWPEHLEKMYRFWQTVLLEEYTYKGSPFPAHAELPVNKEHFDRWLEVFCATIDLLFKGEKAEKAKWQANQMAKLFHAKIEFQKSSESHSSRSEKEQVIQ